MKSSTASLALATVLFVHSVATVSAAIKNVTIYRVTPRNYTGVTDLDTGDAAGDAVFGMYEVAAPVVCSAPASGVHTICKNQPVLGIPGFNIYIAVTVEMDTRLGAYAECNPNGDSPPRFECQSENTECWSESKVVVGIFFFFAFATFFYFFAIFFLFP